MNPLKSYEEHYVIVTTASKCKTHSYVILLDEQMFLTKQNILSR
jgi:hypothetical protein